MVTRKLVIYHLFLLVVFAFGHGIASQSLCNFNSVGQDTANNCSIKISPEDPEVLLQWAKIIPASGADSFDYDLPRTDSDGAADGGYVFAKFAYSEEQATDAEIASSKIVSADDDIKALRFAYYMYGTRLAALTVSKKCKGRMETLWNKESLTTSVPAWHFQQIPIMDSNSLVGCTVVFTVSFYDNANEHHGVIALDNIELSSDLDDNWEPANAYFTSFEYPASSNKLWLAKNFAQSPVRSLASLVSFDLITAAQNKDYIGNDASYDAPQGHVMRMYTSDFQKSGCVSATLQSTFSIKDPRHYPRQCLTMNAKWLSRTMAELNNRTLTVQLYVHLYDEDDSAAKPYTLWSGSLQVQSALDTNSWVPLQAYLDLQAYAQQIKNYLFEKVPNYHLALEGVICSTDATLRLAGIAVDDLGYSVDQCKFNGDDDFESKTSLWHNDVAADAPDYNWLRVPANHSLSFLNPPVDHTYFGALQGWMMVSDKSSSAFSKLMLEMSHQSTDACVTFWTWTDPRGDMTLKSLSVKNYIGHLYDSAQQIFKVTWPANYQGEWLRVTVGPMTAVPFLASRLVIEARGGFAVDDITFRTQKCIPANVENISPRKRLAKQETRKVADDEIRCNFDPECPFWQVADTVLTRAHDHFVVVNASYGFQHFGGPREDSTLLEENSYALLVPNVHEKPDPTLQTAFIVSEEIDIAQHSCLRFAYFMYGPSTGSLKVYAMLSNGTELVPLWNLEGSQEDSWLDVELNLSVIEQASSGTLKLVIEAERHTSTFYGAIAVDNIELLKNCHQKSLDDFRCSFEGRDNQDVCELEFEYIDMFEIRQVDQLPPLQGPKQDASLHSELGHVIYLGKTTDFVLGDWFRFKQTEMIHCASFWVQRGSPCVEVWITLEQDRDTKHRRQLVVPAGDVADVGKWTKVYVDLPVMPWASRQNVSEHVFTVWTRYTEANGYFGCDKDSKLNWVAFDEFDFHLTSACPRPVACDFDDWSRCRDFNLPNLPSYNIAPWLNRMHFHLLSIQGPTDDSAGQANIAAGYALLDMQNGQGDPSLETAIFTTEWMQPSADFLQPVTVQFFYNFRPGGAYAESAELGVYVETETEATPIWELSQGNGNWQTGRASIRQPDVKYRFSFRGRRRANLTKEQASKFSLAVDDVNVFQSLHGGPLPLRADPELREYKCRFEASADLETCNFNWQSQVSNEPSASRIAWTVTKAKDSPTNDFPKEDGGETAIGSYAYVSFNKTMTSPTVAVLESIPIVDKYRTEAVQFQYFMFGTSLPHLRLLKSCHGVDSILWQRRGLTSQDPSWNWQQVLTGDIVGCTLKFEARYDGDRELHGVVALDSIVTTSLWNEIDNQNMPYDTCTFEYETCSKQWANSASRPTATAASWSRVKAEDSGLKVQEDNSLQSPSGYVLQMAAPGNPVQAGCYSAVVESRFLIDDLLQRPIQCLQMNAVLMANETDLDKITGQILIHLNNPFVEGSESQTLWSGSLKVEPSVKSGVWSQVNARFDLSKLAEQLRLTVSESPSSALYIEGLVCATETVSQLGLAIDDVRYNPPTCRLLADDDFEVPDPQSRWTVRAGVESTGFNWIRVASNHSYSYLNPPSDHNFNGNFRISGSVMVSDIETTSVSKLSIDLHQVTSWFCLNFWAWTLNTDLDKKHLKVRNEGRSDIAEAYNIKFSASKYAETWEMITIPFSASASSVDRITLEAVGGWAIDDVFYSNFPCSVRSSDAVTVEPLGGVRIPSRSPTSKYSKSIVVVDRCDFESACSNWTVATSSAIAAKDHFEVVNATYGFDQLNGPRWDSTFGRDIETETGHYAIFAAQPNRQPDPTDLSAFLYSKEFNVEEVGCLSFRYYMYGPSAGSIKVYFLADGVSMLPLWTRKGSQVNQWISNEINLYLPKDTLRETYKLVIEAERAAPGFYGSIAIDDILLLNECPPFDDSVERDYYCTFEGFDRNDCGFSGFDLKKVNTLDSSLGLKADASQGTELGRVAFAQVTDKASKVFKMLNLEDYSCLSLAYQRGSPCNQVWFNVQQQDEDGEFKISRHLLVPAGDTADYGKWSRVQVDLPQIFKPKRTFESTHRYISIEVEYDEANGLFGCEASSPFNWVALDSFYFSLDSCKRPVSCNFENYCGNFELPTLPSVSFMPWLVGNGDNRIGHSTGPVTDSNNIEPISYAMVDLSRGRGATDLSKVAQFSTDWLVGYGKPIMLNFHYLISGGQDPEAGMLSIYIETDDRQRLLWELTGSDDAWHFGRAVAIQPYGLYRLHFRGQRRASASNLNDYWLAVDDVSIVEAVLGFAIPIEASPNLRPTPEPSTTTMMPTEPSTTTTLPPEPSTTTPTVPISTTTTSTSTETTTTTTSTPTTTVAAPTTAGSTTAASPTTTESGTTVTYVTDSPVPTQSTMTDSTPTTTTPTKRTTSTQPPTTTVPDAVIEVKVTGEMVADDLLKNGTLVTWSDVSANAELYKWAEETFKETLKLIYERANVAFIEITVTELKEVKTSNLYWQPRGRFVRAEKSQIGANYVVDLKNVAAGTNLDELFTSIDVDVKKAVNELANEGKFDESFGTTPSVTVQRVFTPETPPEEGLDGGAIAGIVIGCIAGVALIVVGAFFGYKYYQNQSSIKDAKPAQPATSYYDNPRTDSDDEGGYSAAAKHETPPETPPPRRSNRSLSSSSSSSSESSESEPPSVTYAKPNMMRSVKQADHEAIEMSQMTVTAKHTYNEDSRTF